MTFWTIAAVVGVVVCVAVIVGRSSVSGGEPEIRDQRSRSSRWAGPRDVEDLILGKGESAEGRVVFGTLDGHTVAAPRNASVGVVAPTGSGKTSGLVVPAVLRWRGPAVIATIKSDALELTIARRREQGPVWVFDPTGATGHPSCRWSPLAFVTDFNSAKRAARWLADSSKANAGSGDDIRFWEDLGRHLLAPLLFVAARNGYPMSEVAQWVQNRDTEQIDVLVRQAEDARVLAAWNGTRFTAEKTRLSIFMTAQRILEAFDHPALEDALDTRRATSSGEVFSAAAMLDAGGTLYVVAPGSVQDDVTAVFETLVNSVVEEVELRSTRAGGLPIDPRLLLMLDEAGNIASIRKLPRVASAGRGMGIVTATAWQDLAQIERIYGKNGAAEVKSNHQAWCYLPGITDETTLNQVSRLIGQDEFRRGSESVDAGGRVSRSHSSNEFDVAPVHTIRELDDGTMLVFVGNKKPMLVDARGWFDVDELRALIPAEVAHRFDAVFGSPKSVTSRRGRRSRRRDAAAGGGQPRAARTLGAGPEDPR